MADEILHPEDMSEQPQQTAHTEEEIEPTAVTEASDSAATAVPSVAPEAHEPFEL